MRSVLLASALTAGVMLLAFGGTPAQSQTDGKDVSCQTCAKGDGCPHCAAGKDCPHCTEGKTCPYCNQGKTCAQCGKGKAHQGCHGKWGSHKWEYKCVRPAKKPAEMTKDFSGLGEEGWKLVEADSGIWCFSRVRREQ
jgi:hypothetical protein